MIRKGIALIVMLLFIGLSIVPSIGSISKASTKVPMSPPLPPLMWTEDFLTFYILIVDPDGDDIFLCIDWGDGTYEEWFGPYESGEIVSTSHIWFDEGTYQIKIKTRDWDGESPEAVYSLTLSPDFKFFSVVKGYVGITYKFTIYLEGYEYYMFDWGDGTNSGWVVGVVNKSFSNPGIYDLKSKAKDVHGHETEWSELIVITILPFNGAALGITKVKGGIFSFTIKNIGDETALNVSWSIHFEGRIVFPREQHSFNNYNLAPDEERTIVFWLSYIPEDRHLVFGIGRVAITIISNADNTESVVKTTDGFLIFLFVII